MTDVDAILNEIRRQLLQQGASQSVQPARQAMEEISVTAPRPDSRQDLLQIIMSSQPQLPTMGGLTGMPTPGMGPASYNPLFKQGGGYGADEFAKTQAFLKDPSVGALIGK